MSPGASTPSPGRAGTTSGGEGNEITREEARAIAPAVRFSITAKMSPALDKVIADIKEEAWKTIPYFTEGVAVAETTYTPFAQTLGKKKAKPYRLIVRRVPPRPGSQLALYVGYSYHAFITDRSGEVLALEPEYRAHAAVEASIRDLKYGVGWPST